MGNKNNPKKPFKTYNQQLKILRNRNLTISDGSRAISVLKRDNYYNIINGYKDIFLELSGQNEKYYDNTTFEHINALSIFDKKIRIWKLWEKICCAKLFGSCVRWRK